MPVLSFSWFSVGNEKCNPASLIESGFALNYFARCKSAEWSDMIYFTATLKKKQSYREKMKIPNPSTGYTFLFSGVHNTWLFLFTITFDLAKVQQCFLTTLLTNHLDDCTPTLQKSISHPFKKQMLIPLSFAKFTYDLCFFPTSGLSLECQ